MAKVVKASCTNCGQQYTYYIYSGKYQSCPRCGDTHRTYNESDIRDTEEEDG